MMLTAVLPRKLAFVLVLLLGIIPPAWAEPLSDAIAEIDANVVFMRHALAPGYGDPAHFRVDDCTTQRNLDARGIAQARATGAWLQENGYRFDAILSSAWCRCKDTAENLNMGEWQVFAGLNSFFQGHVDREETLRLLEEQLADISPGQQVLMVTHQVVISAITGVSPPSGGMVVYNTATKASKAVRLDLE